MPSQSDYEQALAALGLGSVIVVHRDSTGSTNDDAKEIAAQLSPSDKSLLLVVAETQTRGRGRSGNVWFSPRGSISLTLAIPDIPPARLGVLPLGVGVCITRALGSLGLAARVKWPNDILIGDQKVCGILCESSIARGAARVFVGVGLNVEAGDGGAAMVRGATSLGAHGVATERATLVADIVGRVTALVQGGQAAEAIVAEWRTASIPWWGEEATLSEGGVDRRIIVVDVDPEGRLVVRDEGGGMRTLISGDVRNVRVIA